MKYCFLLIRLLVVAMGLVAGGLSFEASAQAVVKSVELDAMDISAATSPRLDLNNEPCALIKVNILADNVDFIGNIVGDVTRHGAAYWVYVTSGTKLLRMSSPSFKEIELKLSDWGMPEGVKGKLSYKVDIDLPVTSAPVKVKRGYVTFRLDPPTANVRFNGQLLNISEGNAYKLVPYGNYSYEVSASGYATFSGTVAVNSEKIEVPVKLQSTKASVEVTTATPGCQIYVDGTAIGAAPIVRELMPGDYVLEARRDGYRPREISVSLKASTKMPVNFPELEMITGELSVEYEPVGSEIRLDGTLVGTTPAFLPSVPTGSHKLEISHDGYQTANLNVNISETASTPITGTLTPVNQADEEENWNVFWKNDKYGFKDANGKIVIDALYDLVLSFSEGLAPVEKGGRWGFIDKNNKTIIPFEYEKTWGFSEGLAPVKKYDKWGFIDKNNNTIIPFEYDDFGTFHEGLARVGKGEKYGFIDKNGNTVIPFEYDDAYFFSEGLSAVGKGSKYGFIDKNGTIVIPIDYDFPGTFEDGKARVKKGSEYFDINKKGERLSETASTPITGTLMLLNQAGEEKNWTFFKENGKYGFKDANGKIVIYAVYDVADLFSEGLAAVKKDKKWGFIDKNNKIVIPLEYDNACAFHEGLSLVEKGKKWGFIDRNGNTVIPFEYDKALSFSEGLSVVEKGKKWGFIDRNGNTVIPIEYDDAAVNFSEGLAFVRKGKKWGFIDKNNKIVIPLEYDNAVSFSEGLAPVGKNYKWGFIDRNGKIVIPLEYDDAAVRFSEGLVPIKKGKKWGFIDRNGKIVIPLEYDFAKSFSEGLAYVRKDSKYGFIDKTGKTIIPFEYDDANDFSEGLASVKKNGKCGFIDNIGKIVIPFVYDYVGDFNENKAYVRKGSETFFINKKGERLP